MPEQIPVEELTIVKLGPGLDLRPFDCNDKDLNDFLTTDSFKYEESGNARTYVCLYKNLPVGFFSLCADAIRLSNKEKMQEFGKIKAHSDYPALKIARIGVDYKHQRRGIGKYRMGIAVGKALQLSKEIGIRFVTVDAYPKAKEYYDEHGFAENTADKSGGQNISMRLDLIDLKPPN